MKNLMKAITTQFKTTNSLNTALSGRMYPHEALQGVSFPYGVYYLISHEYDENFTDIYEYANIQFSLFSDKDSVDEIVTLYGYLTALFDDAILSVTGYTMLKFKRSSASLMRDSEHGTWHYAVDYDVILEGEK